jgi:NAD(P)-dependent dehydrogenase (short-subunit alcohol dehydrogenase family)
MNAQPTSRVASQSVRCSATNSGPLSGRAYAIYLARQGARVVVNDIDASKAGAVAGEIVAAGGTARSIAATVAGWTAPPLALEVRPTKSPELVLNTVRKDFASFWN